MAPDAASLHDKTQGARPCGFRSSGTRRSNGRCPPPSTHTA